MNTRGLFLLVALSLFVASPLHAAELKATKPVAVTTHDAKLVGHYYLNGVMETGLELLLRPDGRFQWNFTYGALDLTAEGRWQRDDGHVALDPDSTDGPAQYPEIRFERMRLRIDGDDLIPAWPWENGAERGRYSRE